MIPVPFTAADRAAGYWWELSMRQVEVSRTLVFDEVFSPGTDVKIDFSFKHSRVKQYL